MNGASDDGLLRKISEYQAREQVYRAGLVEQEAESVKLRRMASDVLAAYGDLSRAAVRASISDPTQNMEVLLLRQKLREKDQHIRKLREEREANRFDQQSPAGQALMRKCRALLDENCELGEQIREERISELKNAIVIEQRQTGELQNKLMESVEFTKELQQENEKLQGTMSRVAGRLREARAEMRVVMKERNEAKSRKKREREQSKAALADVGGPAPEGAPSSSPAAAPQAASAVAKPVVPPVAPAPQPVALAPAPAPTPAPAPAPVPVPVAVHAASLEKPEKDKKAKKRRTERDKDREKDRTKDKAPKTVVVARG